MRRESAHHPPFVERIVRDPQTCGGEPVFKGTRVLLRTVLASLAAGDTAEDILADFPPSKRTMSGQQLHLPQLPPKRIFPCPLFPLCNES